MRFLHASCVYFIAALGLYVVVDGFINLDDFQHRNAQEGLGGLLKSMGWHYLCRRALFEMFGPTAAMMGVSTTLALMSKHWGVASPAGRRRADVSARVAVRLRHGDDERGADRKSGTGDPADRLAAPEFAWRSDRRSAAGRVLPEHERIYITGEYLYVKDRHLMNADFRFEPGPLMQEFVQIRCKDAYFLPAEGTWPSGWLLQEARPFYQSMPLTDRGREIVRNDPKSNDLFVITEVTFEDLHNRNASFKYLSTAELFAGPQAGHRHGE